MASNFTALDPRFDWRDTVIISRHGGALRWLAESGYFGGGGNLDGFAVIAGDATPERVRGKHVVGNVPMHIACEALDVWAIEFTGKCPRGGDLTADEMRLSGARLVCYRVQKVQRGSCQQ